MNNALHAESVCVLFFPLVSALSIVDGASLLTQTSQSLAGIIWLASCTAEARRGVRGLDSPVHLVHNKRHPRDMGQDEWHGQRASQERRCRESKTPLHDESSYHFSAELVSRSKSAACCLCPTMAENFCISRNPVDDSRARAVPVQVAEERNQ